MKSKLTTFFKKYFIYFFALGVMAISFTLIFDNVVWGDEAFSGNIIRGTGVYGIFERVFYCENHPPLYYYYLKIFEAIFGQKTCIYHLASWIPFAGGVILAVTAWAKKLGNMPALFFISFSGLSAVCVEYNVEIRMYAICFFFLLLCSYFSYQILSTGQKGYFIGIVIAGVLSAYTHYFGLVTSGILLFVTGLIYFIKNRKNTWLWGVGSIIMYLALYSPWISVLIRQMGYVSGSWWMESPEALDVVIRFIFGGERMCKPTIAIFVVFTVITVFADCGFVRIEKMTKKDYMLRFAKPKFTPSIQLQGIICCAATLVMVIGFSYVLCWVYKPVLAARYMYPLIPVMLTWMMLAISRVIEIAKQWEIKKFVLCILCVLFAVITLLGLLDFKHFRSMTKTQEVNTAAILETIGEVDEDTVISSIAVKHLAWTVLGYYYPEAEIVEGYPTAVREDAKEIWSFYTMEFDGAMIDDMVARGYEYEFYGKMYFAKYDCYLYHFYLPAE